MGVQLLHSICVQDQAIAADGVYPFDLAVNPLSVVRLAMRPLNETSTLSAFESYLGIMQAINRLTIAYRGDAIISGRGADLAALNYFRHGILPMQANHNDTDNDKRCVVLDILMGRNAYDPESCFPASRRGELIMELDIDVADTGYDNFRLSVETVELLGANPKSYEKKTTQSQTFAATGDNDVDLPVGNPCRGVLLFGTTGFKGGTGVPSWGRIQSLLDNRQVGYAGTDFEVAQSIGQLWGRQPPMYDGHRHRVDATAASATQETLEAHGVGQNGMTGSTTLGWGQYAFLDFDVTRDDTFTLDTAGARRFNLRANAKTADAVRAIPIEVIKVSGGGGKGT
jgi:hypothetical protein